jgi:hypothetical protein
VVTGRATIIDVGEPFGDRAQAQAWLAGAGEDDLAIGLRVLNRVLHAHRVATADPYAGTVSRAQALVARIGFGAGEQVADGQWAQARELLAPRRSGRRTTALHPQARLADALTGRGRLLACEELVLRARLDLDQDRPREAALQVLVALDAAVAELAVDPLADALADRLDELRAQRDPVAAAGQSALAGPLAPAELEAVGFTVGRIEAALRARAAARR